MSKFITSLFLIFAMLTASMQPPILAQPVSKIGSDEGSAARRKAPRPDLKSVFSVETERFKAESSVFDPIKTDRKAADQQAQKKGWSKTKKTLVITAIVVGFAALLFVAIKYGKKCLRSDPENCTPGVDENCVCLEYERRNP